jgi:hypothetical protein
MKKQSIVVVFLTLGASLFLTVGAERAAAQGPAGAGASTAAAETSHSSHSLNPIKWVKKDKDSKNSGDSSATRSDLEKKLTPKLQAQGLLPANANATDTCAPFTALNDCLAALHASRNLSLDFTCLRANVTGMQTSADLSGCKGPVGDKAMNLNKAIHAMNPAANAKAAAKTAEQQAKDDLKDLGS